MTEAMDARGREARNVRESGSLPLAWEFIDDARLGQVIAQIDRRLNDPTIPTPALAAIVRLLLILQTGRTHEKLGPMIVRTAASLTLGPHHVAGIIVAPEGSLLLIDNPHPDADPDTPFLALPTLPTLDHAARDMSTRLHDDSLFRPGARLDKSLHDLIRSLPKSTKAENGDAALRRWLQRRMREVDGGDPAISAILHPSEQDVRKTVSAYFSCDGARYWTTYAKALQPIAPSLPAVPPDAAKQRYGTRHCPSDADLRRAISPLRKRLALPPIEPGLRSDRDPSNPERFGPMPILRDWHVAMTLYTFALVSFGTGQRCRQRMADSAAIDPESGFAWVIEKGNPNHGTDGARGVYHCRMVRRQIATYEKHCCDLADKLDRHGDADAAKAVRDLLAAEGLRFFDYSNGRIREIEGSDLFGLSPRFAWPFKANAGRKWLRSAISGKAPSDAIAAQFGHHHDGISVWASPSGLRPDDVRRSLEQAINRIMEDAGFSCLPIHPRPLPKLSPAAPDRVPPPISDQGKAGRIAASAMWHGALLNEDRLKAVLEKAQTFGCYDATPDWFDLDRRSYAAQDRWFIDPRTRALLDARRKDRHQVSGRIDSILAEFLRSPKRVAGFKSAAERRWRFKLPPVLFALASGDNAGNHSLLSEKFDPGAPRMPAPLRKPPVCIPRQQRETVDRFLDFLNRCWPDRGTLPDKKKRAHADSATLPDEPFFALMSPFEQSLATAAVAGFQARRHYNDPSGDDLSVIRERVMCLWCDVVPEVQEPWEKHALADLSFDALQLRLNPLAPWRGQVANHLATLLIDSGAKERDDPMIGQLREIDRNHTADVLRPAEYRSAVAGSRPSAGDAMILSYRAGLRFGERAWIAPANLTRHRGVDTLTLDHSRYDRLKTFESRRRIPIGLLLPAGELDRIRALVADPIACAWLKALASDDRALLEPLCTATGTRFNFYPLRHSFATNAYAAILWPDRSDATLERFFDPHLLDRRQALRRHLCGVPSLGATALHAVAMMMGHTHPWRTLFSYVHHLEVILAAWVRGTSPNDMQVDEPVRRPGPDAIPR